MKHIDSFHGSVTALLSRSGYDSRAVLNACNAWRGGQKGEETKATGKVSLTGKVTAKGKDNRRLNVTDNVTVAAKKLAYHPAGALIALSEDLHRLTDKHGIRLELSEFSDEISCWLDRDSFRPVQGPTEKSEENVTA